MSASWAALKSRLALPRVLSGPNKNVALCHSFFPRALASEVRSQGVCVCFAQWLNQCWVHALVGRCADRAIDTRSIRSLPLARRSITKPTSVVRPSTHCRISWRSLEDGCWFCNASPRQRQGEVERVSIAGLARRPTGAWEKLWLSHWAKPTHMPSDRTSEAKDLWKKE